MARSTEKYSNLAIFLHWFMALLIFTMFGLGWYMVDLPKGSPERTWFFALHKSIGLTLALSVLIRLGWRMIEKPPVLPDFIPVWKSRLATMTHHLLYFLMFLQPVSGYISSSFSGYKTKFWGFPLPHWGWKDVLLNELFTDIHVGSSIALLFFICLHLAGAIAHMIESQSSIIKRMYPW